MFKYLLLLVLLLPSSLAGCETISTTMENPDIMIFDGVTDRVTLQDSDYYTLPDGFTIKLWAYIDSTQPQAYAYIVAKYDHDSTEWEFAFAKWTGTPLNFWLRDDTALKVIGRSDANGFTSFQNQWTHFVLTYDGGITSNSLRIYANGIRVDDVDFYNEANFVSIRNTTAKLRLGARDSAVNQRFKGKISMFKITSDIWYAKDALTSYFKEKSYFE